MIRFPQLPSLAALAMSFVPVLSAQAQYTSDIDIYSGNTATGRPNVLILMDNTANWNTAFPNEIAALKSTIAALPSNKFNVGLMLFTETGSPNNNTDGGYVRAAIRTLDDTYKTKFQTMLSGFDVVTDKSNGGKTGKTMAEAYYYFTGGTANSGNSKVKADYTGNVFGVPSSQAIYALPGNALPGFNATQYAKPGDSECAHNYIIYLSNGAAQDSSSDNADAASRLSAAYAALGMTRPPDISGLSPNGSQNNMADEWARFMRNSPSNIATYTLDVDRITTGQGPGWSALLRSMAQQSGGEYFSVSSNGSELADRLASIFNQIQATDSVFSSASLPVSASARGSFDNQVFMGMFRPDRDSRPRWRGNLKQYQFKYDPITDTLALVGADGVSAIGDEGFIATSALSYWTTDSTFWSNQLLGTPPSTSDRPDGDVVEKGGVAQMIRTANATTQANRNLYTCVSCAPGTILSSSAGSKFSTANSSSFTAISSNSTERDQIINWVRGTDNAMDEAGPGGTTTIRPSVHGDVLHSRPLVVNYGGATGVVVFYGANDGTLRAINGKQTGTGAGQELWGFIPEEHFPKLKRLRDNSPKIRISTTDMPATNPPILRDYFVDGPIGMYQAKNASGTVTATYLYVAMRRGGRFIYALDVTDPATPKFLWKKSYTDANFDKLGQTWSEPIVAKIKGNTNPVIIMGAGYDADAEDLATAGTTTMGNAVLIFDAITGVHLKTLNTARSVAADVNVLDSDADGYVDRAYAVDTGGSIYRIDLESAGSADKSVWGIYTLAELAESSTPRKFFYRPDVLRTAKFTAIMVGSGDREKPLYASSSDAFFTIFDDQLTKGTPSSPPPSIKKTNLREVGSTASNNPSIDKGCFIPLGTGEKVVNAATTFLGVTYFGTNQPKASSDACTSNLGTAKTYAAPVFCRAPDSQVFHGGGLPPSPVAGFVTVTYTPAGSTTPVTTQKPFVIGKPNPKKSPLQASIPSGKLAIPQRREYWFKQNAR